MGGAQLHEPTWARRSMLLLMMFPCPSARGGFVCGSYSPAPTSTAVTSVCAGVTSSTQTDAFILRNYAIRLVTTPPLIRRNVQDFGRTSSSASGGSEGRQ